MPERQSPKPDKAPIHSLPDGLVEVKGLKKPEIAPNETVILKDVSLTDDFPQHDWGDSNTVKTMDGTPIATEIDIQNEEEEEEVFTPSKFEKVAQILEDALIQGFRLDPTGEQYTVVVAVTTTNGKIFTIKADSTDDQKYKDVEILGRAYVEAEVTKTLTAFDKKEEARQRAKLLSKKSPV